MANTAQDTAAAKGQRVIAKGQRVAEKVARVTAKVPKVTAKVVKAIGRAVKEPKAVKEAAIMVRTMTNQGESYTAAYM
jgi:hypothetical protein